MTVSGRRSGRLSMAGLIAMRPGSRTRLCHRLIAHPAGKGKRRSLSERDFIALLDGDKIRAAHQRSGCPRADEDAVDVAEFPENGLGGTVPVDPWAGCAGVLVRPIQTGLACETLTYVLDAGLEKSAVVVH
ncbi:hypothetical protein ACIP4W_40730 [Streptomyces sp. NPDC088846]|uniref:hypothetical protein n=1 Tax=Streptomyces sp. NPDC088846 TaxID=3365908 RepID=UPI0037F8D326